MANTDLIVPAASQQSPYYDDYDEDKGFHRVLFRPGYAVQGRELTQLQTILQKQIQRFGESVYENGSMVTGGQITFQSDPSILYINLQSQYANTNIVANNFVNQVIISGNTSLGNTSIARAYVLAIQEASTNVPPVLVVKSLNGARFFSNDTIHVLNTSNNSLTANVATTNPTGNSSIASIDSGVYFYNGFFVKVLPQTIILDAYDNTPTTRVGLQFDDSIMDENDDTSLLDPAQEASNYQAPGAARYQITLTLSQRSTSSTDDTKFIELLRIESGKVINKVTYPIYSDLARTMARRTYDESGNYTVRPFTGELSEHIPGYIGGVGTVIPTSSTITGSNTYFLSDAPVGSQVTINNQSASVTTLTSNVSVDLDTALTYGASNNSILVKNPAKFTFKISPGKAYVAGYEFETIAPTNLSVRRGRDIANVASYTLSSPIGNDLNVFGLKGIPDVNDMEKFDIHIVTANSINYVSSITYANTIIGNTRIRAVEYLAASNTSNALTQIYTMYLFDVNISNTTYTLNNAMSLATYDSANIAFFNKRMDIDPSSKSNNNINGNTVITDTNFIPLIFPLPQATIVPGSITGVNYRFRQMASNVSFTSGSAAITLSSPYAFEGSGALSDAQALSFFTVTVKNNGNLPSTYANGDILPFTTINGRSITVSPATTATLNFGVANNFTADIIYTTQITGTAPAARVKTLTYANSANIQSGAVSPPNGNTITTTNTTIYLSNGIVQVQVTNQNNVVKTPGVPQKLYIADIQSLVKVVDFSGNNITQANLSSATDITSRYTLNNGQTDSYYDQGSLLLNPGAAQPAGPIVVYLNYYAHSGTSGYLTVDSYPSVTTNDGYAAIPNYVSPSKGVTYSLRDCIDWRPKRTNATEAFTLVDSDTGSKTTIFEPGTGFQSTYSYYLGRIDKIVLSQNRDFRVIEGVSSLTPEIPSENPNDMLLYTLTIPPFTFSANTVDVQYNDNKRYTMRDIGKLDKRIQNLEFYAALSLLEQSTSAISSTTSTGLNRFKNGIIVDGFTGHQVGDVVSADYLCSMDFENGILHNPFVNRNFTFLIDTANSQNYSVNSGQVTMNWIPQSYLVQSDATEAVAVNPFALTTYVGNLVIFPDTDIWFDDSNRPQVLINIQGENDAWLEVGKDINYTDTRTNGFGTRWNHWQAGWAGIPTTQSTGLTGSVSGGPVTQTGVSRSIAPITSASSGSSSTSGQKSNPGSAIQIIGDATVDSSVIPFIRANELICKAYNMLPSTGVFPFFDGVGMTGYWQNPTLIQVDTANTSARFYPNSRTDIATSNTGASGLIVDGLFTLSVASNTIYPYLVLVNDIGSWNIGDTITGSVSGATTKIVAVIKPSDNVVSVNANTYSMNLSNSFTTAAGSPVGKLVNIAKGTGNGQVRLISTYNTTTKVITVDSAWTTPPDLTSVYSIGSPMTNRIGGISGKLNIPPAAFLAGQRTVRLSSSIVNDIANTKTYADGYYFVAGLLHTNELQQVGSRPPTNVQNDPTTTNSDVVSGSEQTHVTTTAPTVTDQTTKYITTQFLIANGDGSEGGGTPQYITIIVNANDIGLNTGQINNTPPSDPGG